MERAADAAALRMRFMGNSGHRLAPAGLLRCMASLAESAPPETRGPSAPSPESRVQGRQRFWIILRDGRLLVIEGLSPRALARCLRRKSVSRALRGVQVDDDPDIATSFSMAARCSWVLR